MCKATTQQSAFSSSGRTFEKEDEITLTSVGVDIGSSTSHLVFSKIVMERRDSIYVVKSRDIVFESDVMLTPYKDDTTIDAAALKPFIAAQYLRAGIGVDDVDAGALILTGVAVLRSNARAIGDLFANEAGKFVAVSAGDSLETMLVAFGSGAIALSQQSPALVMNVDIGGGTSKIALCESGAIIDRTVIDVGARLICLDTDGRVSAIEKAAKQFAAEAGVELRLGQILSHADRQLVVERMAERLFEAMAAIAPGPGATKLMRLAPLNDDRRPDVLMFSGGVSEYLFQSETGDYGDLGASLAEAVRARAKDWGPDIRAPQQGIRATVIGASQYTVQVSGSTIFIAPEDTLPLLNIAVVHPELPVSSEALDQHSIAAAIEEALELRELHNGEQDVALYFDWQGSATFRRLDDFCRGIICGLDALLSRGRPLILVTDSDVGGLVGLHCYDVCQVANPVVSVDGIALSDFDFIDIGELLESSGAVPVVIKSLIFPRQ